MEKEIIIAPSILSADFSKLGDEVITVENGGAKWLHIDVMDGMFVPNISFGTPVYKCVRKLSNLFFDVHLMIMEPIRYIKDFAAAGADMIVFHIEATDNVAETVDAIHAEGIKAGIAIKPGTPAEAVIPYINNIEMVLVMSVEPGFGGQKFMPDMLEKAKFLKSYRDSNGLDYHIQMDGGISGANAKEVRESGVNVLVAGSAVFGKDDYASAIISLMN